MEFENFKKQIVIKAKEKGFGSCEVYLSSGESFEVSVRDGEIDKYQVSSHQGVSFRGEYNDNIGYSYSEEIDIDAVEFLTESAKQNSGILFSEEKEEIFEGEKSYPQVNNFSEEIKNITEKQYIDIALKMEEAAKKYDAKITSVNYCFVAYGQSKTAIFNTKGLDVSQDDNDIIAYISVIAQDGDSIKTGSDYCIVRDWNEINPIQVAENAARDAISHLNAKTIKSGKYKTILKTEVMGDLLSTFAGVFYGDNVEKGFSLLKDKIGKAVGSEVVTIKDDGLLENGWGSTAFDSEGVSCKNKTVVEKGVLKTLLHNIKSAKKAGAELTGNGFKHGFKGSVQTACTNFYIENRDASFGDILKSVGNGVYITEVAGLHSGTNTVSGDFSLSAEGFLIENGEITKPIEQITIAGNFFEVLKNIEHVGNDLKFNMPSGGGVFGSPTVGIGEISVSGE